MLIITVFTVTHGFYLSKSELVSVQDDFSRIATIESDEKGSYSGEEDYKPPKHSFIDYSSIFPFQNLTPSYNPRLARLNPFEPFQAIPQVFQEIIVPPDSLA